MYWQKNWIHSVSGDAIMNRRVSAAYDFHLELLLWTTTQIMIYVSGELLCLY